MTKDMVMWLIPFQGKKGENYVRIWLNASKDIIYIVESLLFGESYQTKKWNNVFHKKNDNIGGG